MTYKTQCHLNRFQAFFEERNDQENISRYVKRAILAWREHLGFEGLAASTGNGYRLAITEIATQVKYTTVY